MEILTAVPAAGFPTLALLSLLSLVPSNPPPAAAAGVVETADPTTSPQAETADPSAQEVGDLLARLAAASDDQLGSVLQEAYDAFLVEAREWRTPTAEALALTMHERARAGWSALTLALLSSRMGESARAEQVLREQFERTVEPAQRVELLERRAIAAMGAGHRERALDLLGQALILGGRDAQQMLGRDALARGNYGTAEDLFAGLLPAPATGIAPYQAGEVPAWALRGWGLALLGARADPVGPPTTGRR